MKIEIGNYILEQEDDWYTFTLLGINNNISAQDALIKMKQEMKNKTPMKITEDTKIKDILPEGYELNSIEYDPRVWLEENLMTCNSGRICLPLKKKEVKDFDWYIKEYLKDGVLIGRITDWIENEQVEDIRNRILQKNYLNVPFEIKIGLLKFICDDLNISWKEVVDNRGRIVEHKWSTILYKICPKEFTNSIFE